MNASRAITESTQPPPTVVLCGPAAAGTSTLAARLAEAASLDHPSVPDRNHNTDQQRLADLTLLRALNHPSVVVSAALPHLLPVDNHALIVRLTASARVRAGRLRRRNAGMSESEAHHLLELRDASSLRRLRVSWGIDVATQASRWRADLILGCPDRDECTDEDACVDAVTELLIAAYQVYAHYLTGHDAAALARFTATRRLHPAHLRRCGPALIGPVREFTPAAWRTRMHTELERRAGIL